MSSWTFNTPWIALATAAVLVPLLIAMYLLKLRRRTTRLPSTLLWRQAFEDLQANVPFQRLRFSLLLLLQLLMLGALLLALSDPVVRGQAAAAERVVILLDCSASMSATDMTDEDGGRATRLDHARAVGLDLVESLFARRGTTRVMVVTFAGRPRAVTGFESRPRIVRDAIETVEPTDEPADLNSALALVSVFAARGGSELGSDGPPDVYLISDGTVLPAQEFDGHRLSGGSFRYLRVGPEDSASGKSVLDNVGIVAISARRDFEDPGRAVVFTRLINTSSSAVSPVVTLRVDDAAVAFRKLEIPGLDAAGRPGEATLSLEVECPAGAVLSLSHNAGDQLRSDDVAYAVLPAPSELRIALVHAGDAPDGHLQSVLQQMEPGMLRTMTPAAFEQEDTARLDAGARFDIVVFDRVAALRLPGVPTLSFGAVPVGVETIASSQEGAARMLSWRRDHPLMRHVVLDRVAFRGFGGMRLPSSSEVLASGRVGPVIAELDARGARHVVVGFALDQSNWPADVSFAVFLQNAVELLSIARRGQTSRVSQPGEPISVRAGPTATTIEMSGPVTATLAARPGEMVVLPLLRQIGVYTLTGAAASDDVIAVSLLSDVESDLRPRDVVSVNADEVRAGTRAPEPDRTLWPGLTVAALVLLIIEWLLYCHRARV